MSITRIYWCSQETIYTVQHSPMVVSNKDACGKTKGTRLESAATTLLEVKAVTTASKTATAFARNCASVWSLMGCCTYTHGAVASPSWRAWNGAQMRMQAIFRSLRFDRACSLCKLTSCPHVPDV
eukprot:m.40032 g.40032  ORF g.40032 m.40032 type:complete len:125 (+) comp14782_c0_seq2:2819-3193(+)